MKFKLLVFFVVISFKSLFAQDYFLLNLTKNMDVDNAIRALEDPEFDKYLLSQLEQREIDKQHALDSKKQKQKDRAAYLRHQKEFSRMSKNLKSQKKLTFLAREKKYNALLKKKAEARNKQRKMYLANRNKIRKANRLKKHLLAKKIFSKLSRLPASYLNEKRPRSLLKNK